MYIAIEILQIAELFIIFVYEGVKWNVFIKSNASPQLEQTLLILIKATLFGTNVLV